MKKIALYFLAAAALFAGCSEKNIEPSVNAEDAWMYDASLPVPIKFTMGDGSLTKGTQVASLDDMVGKKFGFYAVNSGRDADNMGTYTTAIPALLETGWKQGIGATCQLVDGKYMFDFEDGPYYYGQTDWTPYTFYGYYAHYQDVITTPDYTEEDRKDNVNPSNGYIYVRLAIGHTDILWGKAEPVEEGFVTTKNGDKCYGFNAPYLRNGGTQPVMKFKHVTSCVSFKAEQVTSEVSSANLEIVQIDVLQTPVVGNLFIAHVDETLEHTFSQTATLKKGTVSLTSEHGLPVALSAGGSIALGSESLFICPGKQYDVKISYRVVGSEQVMSYTATLMPTTLLKDDNGQQLYDENGEPKTEEGFVAGYSYTYNFKVYSPVDIRIEAEIEPYKPAFDKTEDIDPEDFM